MTVRDLVVTLHIPEDQKEEDVKMAVKQVLERNLPILEVGEMHVEVFQSAE